MLVLTRKAAQQIVIPELDLVVEVLECQGGRVRLGIQAPRSVRVVRSEGQPAVTTRAFSLAEE
jgi:carbon storage regulator